MLGDEDNLKQQGQGGGFGTRLPGSAELLIRILCVTLVVSSRDICRRCFPLRLETDVRVERRPAKCVSVANEPQATNLHLEAMQLQS